MGAPEEEERKEKQREKVEIVERVIGQNNQEKEQNNRQKR
jgi:hypothetical protein